MKDFTSYDANPYTCLPLVYNHDCFMLYLAYSSYFLVDTIGDIGFIAVWLAVKQSGSK